MMSPKHRQVRLKEYSGLWRAMLALNNALKFCSYRLQVKRYPTFSIIFASIISGLGKIQKQMPPSSIHRPLFFNQLSITTELTAVLRCIDLEFDRDD